MMSRSMRRVLVLIAGITVVLGGIRIESGEVPMISMALGAVGFIAIVLQQHDLPVRQILLFVAF